MSCFYCWGFWGQSLSLIMKVQPMKVVIPCQRTLRGISDALRYNILVFLITIIRRVDLNMSVYLSVCQLQRKLVTQYDNYIYGTWHKWFLLICAANNSELAGSDRYIALLPYKLSAFFYIFIHNMQLKFLLNRTTKTYVFLFEDQIWF